MLVNRKEQMKKMKGPLLVTTSGPLTLFDCGSRTHVPTGPDFYSKFILANLPKKGVFVAQVPSKKGFTRDGYLKGGNEKILINNPPTSPVDRWMEGLTPGNPRVSLGPPRS